MAQSISTQLKAFFAPVPIYAVHLPSRVRIPSRRQLYGEGILKIETLSTDFGATRIGYTRISSIRGTVSLSDFACRVFMRRNISRIDRNCLYTTENEIFRRIPGLRELLTSITFESEMMRMTDEPVRYRERHYYVDRDGDFFGRRDDVRYRHSRVDRALALGNVTAVAVDDNSKGKQGALFDGNTL